MVSRNLLFILVAFLLVRGAQAQNCCAPAVPQQGVLGETVALPHVLELGIHYEYLRSRDMYDNSDEIENRYNTEADWQRATLTAAYGVMDRLSLNAIIPYAWKEKSRDTSVPGLRIENSASGIGDITLVGRYSLIPRNYVTFRELSVGFGVKAPTGQTDKRNFGAQLPLELQPGTGSWDFYFSLSFYQGYETADFLVSGSYILTTRGADQYEFGNQFFYLFDANLHMSDFLDLSLGLSGTVRGEDRNYEMLVLTDRHQLWLVAGLEVFIPGTYLGVQAYFEQPLFQHFGSPQLASDYNLRTSVSYLIPLRSSQEY